MPNDEGVVQFKDFTPTKTIRFRLGDDTFECLPVVPVGATERLVRMRDSSNDASTVEKTVEFVELLLAPESRKRFADMAKSDSSLLGVTQIRDLIEWLVEVHNLRPTKPSSDSSNGSDDTSGSSMLGQLPEA